MRRLLLAAPVTIDLLNFEREAFIDEVLKRTRLLFADYDSTLFRYGLVDREDPRTALSGDVSRPFSVSVNATDSSTIDVSGGTAVFSSGEIIVLDTGVERLSVPGGLGTQSVVYLQFSEQEKGVRLTRWDTDAATFVDFLDNSAGYIKVSTRGGYDSLTLADRDKTIPLALVTVQEVVSGGGATATTLIIDHTASQLGSNRPWFSPVDVEHRSYRGSGIASITNPHAISLNDVSASATSTLFQLHLDHGMIVSKDKSLAKVPGKICVETILEDAVTVDTGGLVTGISNAYWFKTANFPTLVLRVTDAKDKKKDYAPLHIKRTNRVFLLPADEYAGVGDIEVTYMTTDAAEPPTDTPLTSLEFKPISADRETAISGGLVVDFITDPVLSFSDAGPIPQKYIVYLDSTGVFRHYPQTCATYVKLSDIGTTPQVFSQNLIGLAPVKVALQGAVASPTLSVKIQITGQDQFGSTITDEVIFTSSNWSDNSSGNCTEEPKQFLTTANSFTSLSNYVVEENIDSGPNASIAMYGDITPELTPELADILPTAEVTWDGLQVCELEDIRPINTHLELPRVTKFAGAALGPSEGTLVYTGGTLFNFWLEDFDQPKFITTEWSDDAVAGDDPSFKTSMRKIFGGLDLSDTYVSKPIAVRPHEDSPVWLRFIPIEPERNFKIYARYFDGSSVWSPWTGSGSMVMPPYSLNLGGATSPLIKWQMAVTGQCKGIIVVYVVDLVAGGALPASFAYDIGVWDNGAFS